MAVITLEVTEQILASDGTGNIIVKLANLNVSLAGKFLVCSQNGNFEFSTTPSDAVNYPIGTTLTLS